jgi:hypothetical protein
MRLPKESTPIDFQQPPFPIPKFTTNRNHHALSKRDANDEM